MSRGVGGGGSHSSFSHSSFGGTHSSYHHSSSSSSSSHSSSSSSYHHSSYTPKPTVTHTTNNVFVSTVDNSVHEKNEKKEPSRSSRSVNRYDYGTYDIVKPKIKSRSEREWDEYTDAKWTYDDEKRKIENDQSVIDKTNDNLNKIKSNPLYKYSTVIILLSVFLSISTIVFFILTLTSIHRTAEDSFVPLSDE